MTLWWNQYPTRYEAETFLLEQHYPNQYQLDVRDSKLNVLLRVHTRRQQYGVRLVCPKRFPNAQVATYIDHPWIEPTTPHRFGDGRLCTAEPWDISMPNTTIKVYADWAWKWIKAYERWLKTGKFPDRRQ